MRCAFEEPSQGEAEEGRGRGRRLRRPGPPRRDGAPLPPGLRLAAPGRGARAAGAGDAAGDDAGDERLRLHPHRPPPVERLRRHQEGAGHRGARGPRPLGQQQGGGRGRSPGMQVPARGHQGIRPQEGGALRPRLLRDRQQGGARHRPGGDGGGPGEPGGDTRGGRHRRLLRGALRPLLQHGPRHTAQVRPPGLRQGHGQGDRGLGGERQAGGDVQQHGQHLLGPGEGLHLQHGWRGRRLPHVRRQGRPG